MTSHFRPPPIAPSSGWCVTPKATLHHHSPPPPPSSPSPLSRSFNVWRLLHFLLVLFYFFLSLLLSSPHSVYFVVFLCGSDIVLRLLFTWFTCIFLHLFLLLFFYSFLPRYSPPSVYFGFLNNVFCIVLRLFPFLTFSTIILHLNLQPFLFFDIYFTFPSFALHCHSQDALQEMCCTMHQLPSCFSLNCSTFLI